MLIIFSADELYLNYKTKQERLPSWNLHVFNVETFSYDRMCTTMQTLMTKNIQYINWKCIFLKLTAIWCLSKDILYQYDAFLKTYYINHLRQICVSSAKIIFDQILRLPHCVSYLNITFLWRSMMKMKMPVHFIWKKPKHREKLWKPVIL